MKTPEAQNSLRLLPPRPVESPNALTRRRFVSRCAACMACGAASLLSGASVLAAASGSKRPKVRLVFCETPNDQPIWPHIGYDFAARRQQISALLTQQCPDIEFLTARLMNDPKGAGEVLKQDAEVDGYLVCVQGLGWDNHIVELCATGKPTLLVDNLFGGSGLFLREIAKIMSAGKPVDWVSSANDQDLAASARRFADLEKLTEHWAMGWHRVTFYGDLQPQVKELCARLKLQLIEEA